MQITTLQQAQRLVPDYDRHTSVVVSETGDIYLNGDLKARVDEIEKQGKKYFIVKGEIEVKKRKTKRDAETE